MKAVVLEEEHPFAQPQRLISFLWNLKFNKDLRNSDPDWDH